LKILIVSQYFWPENFYINQLAIDLKKRGMDVDVLTAKPNYPEGRFYDGYKAFGLKQELWHGVKIFRVPIFSRGNKSKVRLVLNYISFVVSGVLLSPFQLLGRRYDIIFVFAPSPIFQVIPASFLGWLKGVPVVLWVQDLWPQSAEATGYVKSGWILRLLEKLVRFCYAHTDLILVQSKAFIESVSKLAPKIPVLHYPNSVDMDFYAPKQMDVPVIDSLSSGFRVVFAGNVGEAQSMETIVMAAEKLLCYQDIKIIIIGSGSKIDYLSKMIKERSLINVFLAGRYPIETMPTLMRQASALLVSLKNQPIFSLTIPSKVQAYLAVGKPIIASLNGEGASVIRDANVGFAVPAEDAEGLARAILRMSLMSDEERAQLGENGRAYFKRNFDFDTLITELIGHFKKLIVKKDSH
jgi:glycosyltransferase involved in cell wall biosynthesis